MVRWLWSFLQNRQARVGFGDSLSESRTMRQGVPQGSVLSPLLFVFCINNLATLLEKEEGVTVSLFADDVSLLGTDENWDAASKRVPEVVKKVEDWSSEWKLKLNVTKSEVSFFSRLAVETEFEPWVKISNSTIPYKKFPRLLGTILDCQLSFGKQVETLRKDAAGKIRMLAAIGDSEWGRRKDQLKIVYDTFVMSNLGYANPGWQPSLSDSNMEQLEIIQRKAAAKSPDSTRQPTVTSCCWRQTCRAARRSARERA